MWLSKSLAEFAPAGANPVLICFPRRHVRRGKHFSGCKCGGCPPQAVKPCARQTASFSKKRQSRFFDSFRRPLQILEKPRRVRARRREANKSRFLQRHVRRRKHFSARKCGLCPQKTDKACARWAASGSKKRRSRFFDGQRERKPSGFRSLWLDSLTCGPQNTYG